MQSTEQTRAYSAPLSESTLAVLSFMAFLSFILYAPPAVAVVTMVLVLLCLLIASVSFAADSITLPAELAGISVLLLVAFLTAISWPLLGGSSIAETASSLKFLGFFAAFLIGVSSQRSSPQIETCALWLIVITFAYHFAVRRIGLPSLPFYPTDPNTTMILSAVLFPVAFRRMAWFLRPITFLFWIYYAGILDSRMMLLVAPILLLPYPFFLRARVLIPVFTILTIIVLHNLQINWDANEDSMFGEVLLFGFDYNLKFSDRVRIDLWIANLDIWGSNLIGFFPKGESWILAEINQQMTGFTRAIFTAQNSHNLVIEIIGVFGFLTAVFFVGFFVVLLAVCYKHPLLRLLIPLLFLVTLIEPGINDSRVFLIILVFFGMLARECYAGRQDTIVRQ